jgi:membrane-associated protein
LLGYYFGNLPAVKRNFTFVIFAIILISLLPGIIGFIKQRIRTKAEYDIDATNI